MSNYENNDELFTPSAEDFTFVQVDKKIYDKKFETKTTTFAKDAFKRFCKNKSSVVGAIIIGVLLVLSFLMPVVIPYDIESPDTAQSLLKPKLFETGTGFWDGTEKYYDVSWNANTESPNGFSKYAVVKIFEDKVDELTNTAKETASGGYVKFVATFAGSGNSKYFQNYTAFPLTRDGGVKVTIKIGNVDNLDGQLGEYRFALYEKTYDEVKKKDIYTDLGEKYKLPLTEWTTNHNVENGTIELDLSSYLDSIDVDLVENTVLRVELKKDILVEKYILIESIVFTAENVDLQTEKLLEDISFTDANLNCLRTKNDLNEFPIDYWQSSGRKDLYAAKIRRVSFVYDTYAAALGLKENKLIGGSDIQKYIDNGWCEYDFEVGPSSFKILDEEKCPVVYVNSQEYIESKDVYNIFADVIDYRYKGYDKMPSYLLGTTAAGKDLVKLAFKSLRTSLLIAIISSSICLCFGLVWGSISGYFGGNVDLAMERFCEILSGVPFIVVMTLTILLLGNNIVVFGLALCLTGWLGVAGRTRTQFYRFKGREYILASRTLGSSDTRLIFRHILPNALGTIVTGSVLMIPGVIFSESTLSYLGLGLKGVESFGVLLSTNQQYLGSEPVLIVFPAIIISLLMISFNLFGNGLRDALNPSLKGSE